MKRVHVLVLAGALAAVGCRMPVDPDASTSMTKQAPVTGSPTRGKTKEFAATTKPGVVLFGTRLASNEGVPGTDQVKRNWRFEVINSSNLEISELRAHFWVTNNGTGATEYEADCAPINFFPSQQFPIQTSLLPGGNTDGIMVSMTYPANKWRADTSDHFKLVTIRAYDGPQDLHDPGHLYTFLHNAKPGEAESAFNADPTLLTVKAGTGGTALVMALVVGNSDIVKYLDGRCGSVTDRIGNQSTAMSYAVMNPDTSVLDYILSKGLKVDVRSAVGSTPLFTAVSLGGLADVQWLLKHGADPNAVDKNNYPPAFAAFKHDRQDVVAALVKGGANPLYHDRAGNGWRQAAVSYGANQDQFSKYGIPIEDAAPPYMETPLMTSARINYPEGWRWYLKHGADPYRKNAQGKDSFELSKQGNTLHTDEFFRADVEKFYKKN